MFEDLNEGQRAAVAAEGNVLVLSPAGSGKTKTVQAAVVRYLRDGWSAAGILVLTFTNKAADELLARLDAAVGKRLARQIRASTFHAFCARTIRDYARALGRTASFTIYDEDDRDALHREIAHQMGTKTGNGGGDAIRRKIGKAGAEQLGTFLRLYDEALVRHNAFDYDGLETGMLRLLDEYSPARAELCRLRHIVVDEYQDTSPIQAQILARLLELTAAHWGVPATILQVGDAAQAIYGWRGGDVSQILALAADPSVQVVRLPINYRSGRDIVALGNALAPVAGSPLDDVRAARDLDGYVELYVHDSDDDCAAHVAEAIAGEIACGARPGDHMVLARTWRDLHKPLAALRAAGVEAALARAEVDPWTTDAMRHVVAVLRLATNPRDMVAARRLAAWPCEVVSAGELARAEAAIDDQDVVERFAAAGVERFGAVLDVRSYWAKTFSGSRSQPGGLVQAYLDQVGHLLARDLLVRGLDDGPLETAARMLTEWGERRIERGAPVDVDAFLQWYAFRTLVEAPETPPPGEGPVRLMTVHAAKGLQARFVHVVGLEDGFWPARRAENIDEETRVFYVAATRAEDYVAFHAARRRRATWGDKVVETKPSALLVHVERFQGGGAIAEEGQVCP